MKNLYSIITALFLFLLSVKSTAQLQNNRCGSVKRVEQFLTEKIKQQLAWQTMQTPAPVQTEGTSVMLAEIIIPVVVHIVLPNPYLVTNADVQAQIDRLNLDFSGFNSDSTNIPQDFQNVRGHSRIRFCLAGRNPSGQLTSGIERRASSTGSDITAAQDPIKYTSLGGLDAWDPNQYLNYWVGADATGGEVLGYAQFPASAIDPSTSDGVFINYKAWGTNKCYTMPSFSMGRTAVHETGHYFGLLHTWGDDGTSCSGDDFADLTTAGSGCALPAGLFNPRGQGNTSNDAGDTPNQGGETMGCPTTSIVFDSCSKTGAGIMYQNLMDYSNDACLTMFTKKQVERMEWVLMNCRTGLTTSAACQVPPNATMLDAAPVQIVNPGGFETKNCSTVTYASALICPGNINPKMRVANNGLTTITSLTIGYRLNNNAPVTQTVNINLPFGADTVLSFAPVAVTTGTSIFKFFTARPNGAADQVPSNDTLTQTLVVLGTANLPVMVDFESATFPPPGWAIDNYNNDETWQRKAPGRNSNWSLFINNFDVDATGTVDDFKSPRLTFAFIDSVIISFELAHKNYPQAEFSDTLSILITNDCGATFQTAYKKWGAELATAGSSDDAFEAPVESDWRRERIALTGAILSKGQIAVVFRNSSQYGNNIFIDNINIEGRQGNTVLKRRGYQVAPTVFQNNFSVMFYQPPADLRFINVYNSIGQLVYSRQFQANTNQFFTVDLTGKAAGAYVVKIGYNDADKNRSEWIFKQ